MSHSPPVSVLIRTKNRPELLTSAVESVIAQSYRPLEVVVINDGGADVSTRLQALFGDVQNVVLEYIHHPISEGRTASANEALAHASSPLAIFLDDDDYFDPEHIQQLVDAHCDTFSHTELGVVHCRARAVTMKDDHETILSVQGRPLAEHQLFYQNVMPILTVLFPTRVRELGIRFDTNFDLFEDWDFWLQVAQHCTWHFIATTSCAYRIHVDSSGVRDDTKQHKAYQQIYQKWLPSLDTQKWHTMLANTHSWHEKTIEALQLNNQEELNRIGSLHQFALDTIQHKDRDIEHLTDIYQALEKQCIEQQALTEKSSAQIARLSNEVASLTLNLDILAKEAKVLRITSPYGWYTYARHYLHKALNKLLARKS